ncbi:ABC transporter substrate-binding protein [Cohnella abietis]|uniref:Sugar-binding protein n=1 Tax=Cohnella abietis TaxID=2507935 RepID=A0A3T1D6R0_9BACL|nr:extracellular solute-binding protein [Cohnella abietis]BBI33762.1 sugar-binding protein [Cohnella abietis]
MKTPRNMKKAVLIGSIALLTLVTAACGNGNNSSDGKEEGGKVTLNIMHPWTSPNVDNEVYRARIAAFEKLHPEITIKQDGVASAQYKTKLRTLATANNLSDINVVWPGADLKPLVDGNLLLPIDSEMANWSSILPEDALAGFNQDGKQYAIPTKQTFVDIIYYNKEMLAKVGYDVFPDTYDKFIDAVTKLKASGVTPIALGNKEQWPLQSSYLSAFQERFVGSDFLKKVMNKEAKFTDPQYVKAIGAIEELSNLKAFNTDANNMDSVQAQDYFIQGKAAMHISSSTVDSRIRITNAEGDKYGIALFPSVTGGLGDAKKSSGVVQFGIALSSELKGKKKDAALEFMKFFVNEDLYKELISKGVVVPAKVDIPADASEYLKEMMALTGNGTSPVFDSVIPTQVTSVMQNGLQAITVGRMTAEQLAKDVQAALDNMK